MKKSQKINIFWFRRDLRIEDNIGLAKAFADGLPVLPVFIFDKNILDKLQNPTDARVTFIYDTLKKIDNELREKGSGILILHGSPLECWNDILERYNVNEVFYNKDYEEYGHNRDVEIKTNLLRHGIKTNDFKDHVIYEPGEVLKSDGTPYTVYTPFSKVWKAKFLNQSLAKPLKITPNWTQVQIPKFPEITAIGFEKSDLEVQQFNLDHSFLSNYAEFRDNPSADKGTNLGPHLRFGTISVRKAVKIAFENDEKLLNELIWREFFIQILAKFPHVSKSAFKPKYDKIDWENNELHFQAWCDGKTGYPFVDAGMRELKATGRMHNRVRMIAAGFLCKHLLIDWRWGEAWFARHLLDYELASNNGNWQWAAGTGCDAAPYFRIFNPETQLKNFDLQLKYVKKWIPEFETPNYSLPIVEHKWARERCLVRYKAIM